MVNRDLDILDRYEDLPLPLSLSLFISVAQNVRAESQLQ